ncbi:hypothetical protein [Roseomonas gilardii]|uniref:hypothetical protein n=1 Tax=Roseomonas gilardii TaxID=257708 RepID=UPI0011A0F55E|nr:hypothetical protein [Roseomonas gilardii]
MLQRLRDPLATVVTVNLLLARNENTRLDSASDAFFFSQLQEEEFRSGSSRGQYGHRRCPERDGVVKSACHHPKNAINASKIGFGSNSMEGHQDVQSSNPSFQAELQRLVTTMNEHQRQGLLVVARAIAAAAESAPKATATPTR